MILRRLYPRNRCSQRSLRLSNRPFLGGSGICCGASVCSGRIGEAGVSSGGDWFRRSRTRLAKWSRWKHYAYTRSLCCSGGASNGFRSLGVDAEPQEPLSKAVFERVTLEEERRHLQDLAKAESIVCWDRLLFCAKEAMYKVQHPLTQSFVGFKQATVFFIPEDETTGNIEGRFLLSRQSCQPYCRGVTPQTRPTFVPRLKIKVRSTS